MKRIVALMAAASIIVGAYPAQGQVPAIVAGEVEQFAFSDWTVKQNGKEIFYFAAASRGGGLWSWGSVEPDVNPNGYGVVGKGSCRTKGNTTFCFAKGRVYYLEPGDFEFDPLLASARMSIDEAKDRHEVIWTGEGDMVYPDFGVGGDLEYAGGGAGMIRQASIEGMVFGRPLKHRTPTFSLLAEGAGVIAGVYMEGRRLVMNDDGTVTLHYRVAS